MTWRETYSAKRSSAQNAIAQIPKGKHILIGSGAAQPVSLVHELVNQAERFAHNTVVHLLTLGPAPYTDRKYTENFRHNAFFIGPNVREAVHEGRADYTPVFLSQIPSLMRARRMPVDVALIQVSPPDQFGYVNLGVSVDVVKCAVEQAQLVIAEINPNVPVIFGGGFIPMDSIDVWIESDNALLEAPLPEHDEVSEEIGRNVAALVGDQATLQMGIGAIPDAVLKALTSHKDLGVWTEMFSDGVIDLIENGNITGKYKTIHPNKVDSSFTFGTRRLYDYLHGNPTFTFHTSDFINNPVNIARQHRMVAINSALQIDLTGQVCADSIGTKFYSGIGGQVDFIRGAAMCPGGKPIIAIRSTAKSGSLSRIASILSPGAGVVTSRGDVRYVVTEYGAADLQGKSIRERAMALISVAHPDFRGELLNQAKERHYVFSDQVAPRADYPEQYERELTAKDGTKAILRPLKVTDEPKVNDFYYNLSKMTIYRRWMAIPKRMPTHERVSALELDYRTQMAMVIELFPKGEESQIVAMCRYSKDPARPAADCAFVVRDDWHGNGFGRAMVQTLAEVGKDNGYLHFTAEVLQENQQMLHLFHNSGLQVQSTLEDGMYEISIALVGRDRPAVPEL